MTTWNGAITNEDGLVVKFDTDRSTPVTDGVSNAKEKVLEIYLDSQNLDSASAAARNDRAELPANALVLSSEFVATTAFVGTGTLDIGTADTAGSALDANGLHAAIDVDVVLAAVGDKDVGAGEQVGGSVISERAYVYGATSGTVSA